MRSKKILFIKIGAIGDVIMALPAVNFLVDQGFEVTWVVGRTAEAIVQNFSRAQGHIVINDLKLLKGSFFQKLNEIANLQIKLLTQQFDRVILAHSDPRYQILSALKTTSPFRFDFDRSWHHAEAYLELAKRVAGFASAQVEDYLPKPLIPWQGQKSKKIALAPGGAKNTLADDDLRRWPIEYYALLAKEFIAQGYEVHIFGSPSDAWVLSGFQGVPVISEVGKLDLISLVKSWADYKLIVTHDSGPLHLAGLAQIPVYGIFGPTLPEWRFPKGNGGQGFVLDKKLPCQPCYDGKNYAPCSHKNCQRFLTPEIILSKIFDSRLRT